jgi:hypothetical protein
VNDRWTLAFTVTGEAFDYVPDHWPASLEDKAHAEKFATIAEKLLADGKIKGHRPSVRPGGLKGVFDGLQLMREGKVSGYKLVYNVNETP